MIKTDSTEELKRFDLRIFRRIISILYENGEMKRTMIALKAGIGYRSCILYLNWLILSMILTPSIVTLTFNSAYAAEDGIEEIVERYTINADLNYEHHAELEILDQVLEQEMKKSIIDTQRLTMIQDEIDNVQVVK